MTQDNFSHVSSSTPKSSNNNSSKRAMADSPALRFTDLVPVTPMPVFTDMDTPEIRRQAKRYGIKKTLGKAKLRTKLKEVYQYTHQLQSTGEITENDSTSTSILTKMVASDSSTNTDKVPVEEGRELPYAVWGHSEFFLEDQDFKETPKKHTRDKPSTRPRLAKTKWNAPSPRKERLNSGWMLSPSPGRDPSLVVDEGLEECVSATVDNNGLDQSQSKQNIEDKICPNIEDPIIYDHSFGDASRFSEVNMSGVLKMDVAIDNACSPCSFEEKEVSFTGDVLSAKPTQITLQTTPLDNNCNEIISLLDSSNEVSVTEVRDGQALAVSFCNYSATPKGTESEVFDADQTPYVGPSTRLPVTTCDLTSSNGEFEHYNSVKHNSTTYTANCDSTPTLGIIHATGHISESSFGALSQNRTEGQGTSLVKTEADNVISLLDSSDDGEIPETADTTPFSVEKHLPETNASHHPAEHSNKLPVPTFGFADRLSAGSFMDKTYESVDMFDALPRASVTPNVITMLQNIKSCETKNVLFKRSDEDSRSGTGTSNPVDENSLCNSDAVEVTPLDLSTELQAKGDTYGLCSPEKTSDGLTVCFNDEQGIEENAMEVNISNGATSDPNSMNTGESADIEGFDTLENECLLQGDSGSDCEELHHSLFISIHQDLTSSSEGDDEEECISLMQRLKEKKTVVNQEQSETTFPDDGYCNVKTRKQEHSPRNCSCSNSTELFPSSRPNAHSFTDSPAKKQRKVEVFNVESTKLDSEDCEKIPKRKTSAKTKEPKLDRFEMEKEICKAIRSDTELYLSILQYKPVYLSRFKKLMEDNDLKVKLSDLLDFLDNKGITFSTADENKHKGPRVRKKKTKHS